MMVGNGDLAVVVVEALLIVGEALLVVGSSFEDCSISPSVPPPGSSWTGWSLCSSVCLG